MVMMEVGHGYGRIHQLLLTVATGVGTMMKLSMLRPPLK